MTVNEMLDTILIHEGGFVDDPDDRGGATNYGVTQQTYSNWLGRPASVQDVKDITKDVAKKIYLSNYYFDPHIDQLPESIQLFVFDCAVNHGPSRAIKFIQQVCNNLAHTPLEVDGLCGPNTCRAAEACLIKQGSAINTMLVDERIRFYAHIVANDASQQKFLKGWLNRAESFRRVATGT